MCVLKLKPTTKDTDLVFVSEPEITAFRDALFDSGFMEVVIVEEPEYRELNAYAIFEERAEGSIHADTLPRMRIDLFLKRVCGKITFSETMVLRSHSYKSFGRLAGRICSPEDIFLFKAAAGRPRDIDDMRVLAVSGMDWAIVADEYCRQAPGLGKESREVFNESLASLMSVHRIIAPASFTRKITTIL